MLRLIKWTKLTIPITVSDPTFPESRSLFLTNVLKNQFPYEPSCGLYCTCSAYLTLVKQFFNDHFPKIPQFLRPHVVPLLPIAHLTPIEPSHAVFLMTNYQFDPRNQIDFSGARTGYRSFFWFFTRFSRFFTRFLSHSGYVISFF